MLTKRPVRRRISRRSSTISTRPSRCWLILNCAGGRSGASRLRRMRFCSPLPSALIQNQKRLPSPWVDSTFIRPPIRLTNSLEMASPSPAPPWLAWIRSSICSKGLKMVSSLSAGMPIPVSFTAKQTRSLSLSNSTLIATSPVSVNLIALLTRLIRICRSRVGSTLIYSGISELALTVKTRPFSLACITIRL